MTLFGQMAIRKKRKDTDMSDGDDFLEMRSTIQGITDAAEKMKQLARVMSHNLRMIDGLNKALADKYNQSFGFGPALQGIGQQPTVWIPAEHPHRTKLIEVMKDYYVDENVRIYQSIEKLKESL